MVEVFDHLKCKYLSLGTVWSAEALQKKQRPTWVEAIFFLDPTDFGTVGGRG